MLPQHPPTKTRVVVGALLRHILPPGSPPEQGKSGVKLENRHRQKKEGFNKKRNPESMEQTSSPDEPKPQILKLNYSSQSSQQHENPRELFTTAEEGERHKDNESVSETIQNRRNGGNESKGFRADHE